MAGSFRFPSRDDKTPFELFLTGVQALHCSYLAIFKPLDQARQHPCDFLKPILEFKMVLLMQQFSPECQFE